MNKQQKFLEIIMSRESGRRRSSAIELSQLYENGLPIKLEKYKNLQELLPFIPPVHHPFFKNLPHEQGKRRRNALQEDVNDPIDDDILSEYED